MKKVSSKVTYDTIDGNRFDAYKKSFRQALSIRWQHWYNRCVELGIPPQVGPQTSFSHFIRVESPYVGPSFLEHLEDVLPPKKPDNVREPSEENYIQRLIREGQQDMQRSLDTVSIHNETVYYYRRGAVRGRGRGSRRNRGSGRASRT